MQIVGIDDDSYIICSSLVHLSVSCVHIPRFITMDNCV